MNDDFKTNQEFDDEPDYELYSVDEIFRIYFDPKDISWNHMNIKNHYETTKNPVTAIYREIHERNSTLPEKCFAYGETTELPDGKTVVDVYYKDVSTEVPVITIISQRVL
jgi:hypothetical protein